MKGLQKPLPTSEEKKLEGKERLGRKIGKKKEPVNPTQRPLLEEK